MLRALGLRRSEATPTHEESTKMILKQAQDFELALQAMDYLLDDRTEEGLHLINDDPDSTIKTLANGVIKFLESTLGFEPEVMREAGEVLGEAETLSYRDRGKHQRMKLNASSIFPPGTEYAITYAESNLLHALIMLLSESMIESAKALYKLRKAYQTLDEILGIIKAHETEIKKKGLSTVNLNESSATIDQRTNFADLPFPLSATQAQDAAVIGLADQVEKMRNLRLNGSHIGNRPLLERLRTRLGAPLKEKTEITIEDEEKTNKFLDANQSTVDEFIISGTNLCFGILQLVLSLIPPAIGKVLAIVGFKGSREDGLKKIWKSVESRNIHGCIGLLALLVFYDGPFQFTDADFDIPEIGELKHIKTNASATSKSQSLSLQRTKSAKLMRNESNAFQGIGEPTLLHPGKKLEDALLYARAIFPHSALWLLQEARMLTSRGNLQDALHLMNSMDRKVQMKQVEALLIFDKVMVLVFLHQYEQAAEDILKLLKINAWSPALYTYFAGACYLELYRMCKMNIITDKDQLAREGYFRERAKDLISKAPKAHSEGKRTKQLPFDKFVIRKVGQLQEIAKENNLDIIDVIGTSPVHEVIYFWNGYNRMPEADLELSQKLLDYSISSCAKIKEDKYQKMSRSLLHSLIYRRLGDLEKGHSLLDKEIIQKIVIDQPENKKEPYRFIKLTHDPWLYTSSLYEKSLFIWKDKGIEGLDESIEWLKRAQSYADDYELSTRVSMKVKAALDRLENL